MLVLIHAFQVLFFPLSRKLDLSGEFQVFHHEIQIPKMLNIFGLY